MSCHALVRRARWGWLLPMAMVLCLGVGFESEADDEDAEDDGGHVVPALAVFN